MMSFSKALFSNNFPKIVKKPIFLLSFHKKSQQIMFFIQARKKLTRDL